MPVLVEICTDSAAGAAAAAAAGAQRIELCGSLLEGGTTPSYGTIKLVRRALTDAKLMVLIRPRGGDFAYSEDEMEVMLEDIRACAQLGADGVVAGCLEPDGAVDARNAARLLAEARKAGLDFTFHRAFDMSRDLRRGQAAIASLVRQAAGRISILAGGGVRVSNTAALVRATGVAEVHSSARCLIHSPMKCRPQSLSLCGPAPSDWSWGGTDGAAVSAVVAAAAAATTAAAAAGPAAGGVGAARMRCAGAIVAAALLALTLAAGAQARQQVLARNGTAAADTCNPAKPPGPPFVKLDARWGNGAAFIVKEPITGRNLGCVLGLQYQIVSGNAPVPSRLGWKDTGGVHKISTFGPKGKLTLFARAFGSFNSTTLYGRAASRSTTLVVQQPY